MPSVVRTGVEVRRNWKVDRVTLGSQITPQLTSNRLTGPQAMALERARCESSAWGNISALMSKSSFGLQFQLALLVPQGGSAAFCRVKILYSIHLCLGLVRGDLSPYVLSILLFNHRPPRVQSSGAAEQSWEHLSAGEDHEFSHSEASLIHAVTIPFSLFLSR